ncbi:hypothetical protein Tco_1342318 [Tanacetum coccineum]
MTDLREGEQLRVFSGDDCREYAHNLEVIAELPAYNSSDRKLKELMKFKRPSTKCSKSRSTGSRSKRTGTSTRKSTAASERVFDEAEIRETSSDTLDLQFQRVLAGIKEITYGESVELYNVCQKDRFAFNRIMFCRPEERGSTGREIIEHARRSSEERTVIRY